MGIVNEQASPQRRAPSSTGMSEESPNIIPIKKHEQSAGPDIEILARLEKLEDSFLTGLQEIRAVKSELKKHADSISGLEKLLDAKAVADLLGEKERWVYQQAKAKKIPSIKLGKYWKFSPSQLQKWLEKKNSACSA
jgi:excisionase family DNA binding protein